jgi:DNA-binding response OmpR family regulator
VLKHLREQIDSVVPVIFITQKDAEKDIVEALQSGADDYMTKPVSRLEMLARVGTVARRMGLGERNIAKYYKYAPFSLDTRQRKIFLDENEIDMTSKEYDLSLFLFRNIGRVSSRGHLLEMVWGTSAKVNTRTIDTHVSRLRAKLKIDEQPDWQLTSVYRHGYRLENSAQPKAETI